MDVSMVALLMSTRFSRDTLEGSLAALLAPAPPQSTTPKRLLIILLRDTLRVESESKAKTRITRNMLKERAMKVCK